MESFRAVSWAERRENDDVTDEGDARLSGAAGGWRKGDEGRELFEAVAEALYSGNDGVEALDILS